MTDPGQSDTANLGIIYRRTLTVDVAWAGEPESDWSAVISDAMTDGNSVLVDVREGALHECREHVVER